MDKKKIPLNGTKHLLPCEITVYAQSIVHALDRAKSMNDDETWRSLMSLLVLESSSVRSPFRALRATILAGKSGLVAPEWAIKILEKTIVDRFDEKIHDLDFAFGFKGMPGKTTAVKAVRLSFRDENLSGAIYKLTVLGFRRNQAIRMVQQLYGVSIGEEALKAIYKKHRNLFISCEPYVRGTKEWLKSNKEQFLANFQSDSIRKPSQKTCILCGKSISSQGPGDRYCGKCRKWAHKNSHLLST